MDEHTSVRRRRDRRHLQREVKIDFGVLDLDGHKSPSFREKPTWATPSAWVSTACPGGSLERYTEGTRWASTPDRSTYSSRGGRRRSFAFDGYWLDIGRPDDYDRANDEFGAAQVEPALRDLDVGRMLVLGPGGFIGRSLVEYVIRNGGADLVLHFPRHFRTADNR